MSLLQASNLVKSYAGKPVLRRAHLRIEAGEKVGLVGRNGGGKTTLLRILEGQESPDEGSLQLAKGARLGYVPQRPVFPPGETVRQHVGAGLAEARRTAADYERVSERMADAGVDELEALVKAHGRLSERMDFLDAWDTSRRVETVLGGIGLAEELWEREARTLSGGEKSRASLARELVAVPDLLLLDEPTNHLDLAGIEWLEAYLKDLHSAVLIVSHDRRLLDNMVDAICELEFGELRRYPGRYSRYVEIKAERYEADLKAWRQQRDEIRKEEAFIKKHMGSQRTAEAKGRQKKLSRVVRLERPHHDVRVPVIRMADTARGGELVLEAEDLVVGYGDKTVIDKANVRIGRGERIGIVGANGSGKTSLLKVLAGRMEARGGTLSRGHKATCGYFDQETSDLRSDLTPFGTLRLDHPQWTDLEIRDHLARFLFRGDDVDAEVRTLSGGERSRLALARLVLSKPSWLALDEPTNHLDLAARTALEEMLGEFSGALVCISHDRAFLDGLCTEILAVDGGVVRRFPGNYTEYRARVQREAEEACKQRERAQRAKTQRAKRAATPPDAAKPARKPGSGRRSKPKNPYRLEKVEHGIIALEKERDALQTAMGEEEVYRNPDLLREKQFRLAEIERDLDQLNGEWESLIG